MSNPLVDSPISTCDNNRRLVSRGSGINYRGCCMVEMMRWKPVTVFKVLDHDGEPIGEVVQPKAAPIVGRGARTVLLVRGSGNGDQLSEM